MVTREGSIIDHIFERVTSYPVARMFWDPPDTTESCVHNNFSCFSAINKKLSSNCYSRFHCFVHDMRTLFLNLEKIYERDSLRYNSLYFLVQKFDDEIKMYSPTSDSLLLDLNFLLKKINALANVSTKEHKTRPVQRNKPGCFRFGPGYNLLQYSPCSLVKSIKLVNDNNLLILVAKEVGSINSSAVSVTDSIRVHFELLSKDEIKKIGTIIHDYVTNLIKGNRTARIL